MTPIFARTRWAVLVVCGLFVVAMWLYPGGNLRNPAARGYAFFENSLSDLGASVAWNGESNAAGAALAIGGALILIGAGGLSLMALIRLYATRDAARTTARAAGVAGFVACAGLAGAFLTPVDLNHALHGWFSLVASIALLIAAALLARSAAQHGGFRRRVSVAWLTLACAFVVWIAVMRMPLGTVPLALPVTIQKIVAGVLVGVIVLQTYEAERVV